MHRTSIATNMKPDWNVPTETTAADTLALALQLLDTGQVKRADEILTAATVETPGDAELWLAAGICRMRRGNLRSAVAAFEMSAWLDDASHARELFTLTQSLSH